MPPARAVGVNLHPRVSRHRGRAGPKPGPAFAGLLVAVLLAGCAAYPTADVLGHSFTHRITYGPSYGLAEPDRPLHVYIDGDGRAFLDATTVASDPSPRSAYVRRLLASDRQPALLLGRPCYDGFARRPPCSPLVWTHERYSEAVVESMLAALGEIDNKRELVLIGHSGGGTLALLMAQRNLERANLQPRERSLKISGLVTLGANIDVAAWTAEHGYTPLAGSLDPARHLADSMRVPQVHLLGSEDRTVPPALTLRLAHELPSQSIRVMPGYDHDCCWARDWPTLLTTAKLELLRQRAANRRHIVP